LPKPCPSYHDPFGVQIRAGPDPVEQSADVPVGVLAQEAIVELEKGLAVPRRAADVGVDQGHAELVHEVVVAAEELRARLFLGSSVDLDPDRTLSRKARRRAIEEARDLKAVEALPGDGLRLGEGFSVESPGLAEGQSLEPSRGDVLFSNLLA
jgi:hypothetical protein